MKKLLLASVFSVLFATAAFAQPAYKNELGLRFGSGTSIDYRRFTSGNTSLEAMLGFRWRGFTLTGLYEKNFTVIREVPGFNLYIGGGAHIGFWDTHKNHPWYHDHYQRNYMAVGIDGILGLEYTFKGAPVNLSLDWKPMLNFIEYASFWAGDFGFSVRYAFN